MPGRISDLESISIFQELEEVDLAYLSTLCSSCTYVENQLVYQTGEAADAIHFVVSGLLKAKAYGADGKEVSFLYMKQGDVFGLSDALGDFRYLEIVETCSKSSLISFPKSRFEQVILDHPSIGLKVLVQQSRRYRAMQERVFEFSTLPVKVRIRAELLRIAEEKPVEDELGTDKTVDLSPAPSHYEIAARTSTHREAVSRELAHLTAAGILETGRRTIRILDMPRLAGLVKKDMQPSFS